MSGTMGRRPARKHRSKVDRRAADRRTSGSAAYEEAERRMIERRIGDRRTVGLGSVHVRSWTVVAFVSLVALGGGVMVSGLPSSSETFVLPASATSTTVTEPISGGLATMPDGSGTQPTDPDSTDAPHTTEPATTEGSESTTTDASESTTTDASESTTTDAPDETVVPTTDGIVAAGELEVVLANGAGEAGLATRTALILNGVGYTSIVTTDAVERSTETVIYFADGLEAEAMTLAVALNTPDARLEPKADTPVTEDGSESDADLVVILGPSD